MRSPRQRRSTRITNSMCSTTWCETSSGVVGASGLDVAVVAAAAADLVDEAHFLGVGLDGREGGMGGMGGI